MKRTKTKEKRPKGGIKSMTGFGRGIVKSAHGEIIVEIKSLNNKNLSVSCLAFENFFLLEEKLKKIVEEKAIRGKIYIKLSKEELTVPRGKQKVTINEKLLKEYYRKIKGAKQHLGIKGEINVQDLINFPGVVIKETETSKKEEQLWPHIRKAAKIAVSQLIEYRLEEGAKLAKDFTKRLTKINGTVKHIQKFEKQSIEKYRKKLSTMMKAATGKKENELIRLEDEVALFARNCDIAEEITRLEHHVETFLVILDNTKNDVGKKLDFVAQEMQRETNTIGAKADDYRISKAVIEIKSEIEKIREQVKNIE
jgi:uncharacterized protein (TIGR00255 family)